MAKLHNYPYGFKSVRKFTPLELELRLFNLNWKENRAHHFREACKILWPEDAKSPVQPFVWHPWADRMLEYACEWQYLGLIGCASSGKSQFGAIWAIVNWLAAPKETMVLVTSTSLSDSRKRVWGDIKNFIGRSTLGPLMPCKLVDSKGLILTRSGDGTFSDKEGVALIAGAPDKERESIGKLIGIKQKRVILVADELPELSPALLEAAYSNLSAQIEGTFQMVGIGNFASIYDPLGEFVKPVGGWKAINPSMQEWKTEKGYCLRFDGLQSPNVLSGTNKWPVYGTKQLEEHKRIYKENSSAFWRMVRSFPCPEGAEDIIYSDADFIQFAAQERVFWAEPPVSVGALDPSFTTGGDRAMAVKINCGYDTTGNHVVQVEKTRHLVEDVMKTDRTRNYQIAEAFRDWCVGEGILPYHSGVDSTGGGSVFRDILVELWSPQVLAVQFGGKASELQVNASDPRPSYEHYCNRVAELWYFGLELMKGNQLKGIPDDMAMEMRARKFELVKGATVRIRVEPKDEMKVRLLYSPDLADSLFVGIDVCRVRLGLMAGASRAHVKRQVMEAKEEMKAVQAMYDGVDYSNDEEDNELSYSEP